MSYVASSSISSSGGAGRPVTLPSNRARETTDQRIANYIVPRLAQESAGSRRDVPDGERKIIVIRGYNELASELALSESTEYATEVSEIFNRHVHVYKNRWYTRLYAALARLFGAKTCSDQEMVQQFMKDAARADWRANTGSVRQNMEQLREWTCSSGRPHPTFLNTWLQCLRSQVTEMAALLAFLGGDEEIAGIVETLEKQIIPACKDPAPGTDIKTHCEELLTSWDAFVEQFDAARDQHLDDFSLDDLKKLHQEVDRKRGQLKQAEERHRHGDASACYEFALLTLAIGDDQERITAIEANNILKNAETWSSRGFDLPGEADNRILRDQFLHPRHENGHPELDKFLSFLWVHNQKQTNPARRLLGEAECASVWMEELSDLQISTANHPIRYWGMSPAVTEVEAEATSPALETEAEESAATPPTVTEPVVTIFDHWATNTLTVGDNVRHLEDTLASMTQEERQVSAQYLLQQFMPLHETMTAKQLEQEDQQRLDDLRTVLQQIADGQGTQQVAEQFCAAWRAFEELFSASVKEECLEQLNGLHAQSDRVRTQIQELETELSACAARVAGKANKKAQATANQAIRELTATIDPLRSILVQHIEVMRLLEQKIDQAQTMTKALEDSRGPQVLQPQEECAVDLEEVCSVESFTGVLDYDEDELLPEIGSPNESSASSSGSSPSSSGSAASVFVHESPTTPALVRHTMEEIVAMLPSWIRQTAALLLKPTDRAILEEARDQLTANELLAYNRLSTDHRSNKEQVMAALNLHDQLNNVIGDTQ